MTTAIRFITDWLLVVAVATFAACGGDDPIMPGNEQSPARADLSTSVTGPSEALQGESVTYSVVVSNGGPDRATDIIVTDKVSGGFVLLSASSGGEVEGSEVVWSALELASGASVSLMFTFEMTGTGPVSHMASAISAVADPDPANNDGSAESASIVTNVASAADVVASLDGPQSSVSLESETYAITVRNDGPSAASGVVASIELPAGLHVSAISNSGTATGDLIEWNLGSLDVGSEVLVTVDFTTPAIGPFVARASAGSDVEDPNLSNNRGLQGLALTTVVSFDPVWTITGETTGENFGWVMENIGDVNGDGMNDVAITAPGFSGNRGRVYVRSGATGEGLFVLEGMVAGEQFGAVVDGPGDVDGDNVPDLVVGAPASSNGRAYVHSGADGSLIAMLEGETAGDNFGIGIGRVGDVDGDGLNDVLVGATGFDGTGFTDNGRVYLFSSATWTALWTKESIASASNFGQALSGLPDTNGDGVPEVLVGASRGPGGGRIYAFDGASGEVLFPSIGALPGSGQLALFWLEAMGDINADGVVDFFASDISNTVNGNGTGRAYVFSGTDGSVINSFDGERAGDNFGIGRSVDDVDGDGLRDLFVAAWLSSEGASQAGKAYVYSSSSGALLRAFTSTTPGQNMGFDAIGIGDVTGDGLTDFIISGGISGSTPGTAYLIAGIPVN